MSYADIDFAMVPAAPPARKNQRATSWPAPISAMVPYQRGSRLIRSALCSVSACSASAAAVSMPLILSAAVRFDHTHGPYVGL